MSETGRMAIELQVNGSRQPALAAPHETLLTVLRERLGLTGTKRGCNQGVCGACTVLIDGEPMRACLSLALACTGRAIETVEGLGDGLRLSPVQQALVDKGATQCGFCTPGMAIALTALLRRDPAPDAEDVREAISGHLCRCSGYVKIIEAGLAASRRNEAP